jgi:hypothetical protein
MTATGRERRSVPLTSSVELSRSGVYVEHGDAGDSPRDCSRRHWQVGLGRKDEHGTSPQVVRTGGPKSAWRWAKSAGSARPGDGVRGSGTMSHVARVEVPGTLHLVEQRVRNDLRFQSRFPERRLSAVMYRFFLGERGVQLCGFNFLPSRTLLVVVPTRRGAIARSMSTSCSPNYRGTCSTGPRLSGRAGTTAARLRTRSPGRCCAT